MKNKFALIGIFTILIARNALYFIVHYKRWVLYKCLSMQIYLTLILSLFACKTFTQFSKHLTILKKRDNKSMNSIIIIQCITFRINKGIVRFLFSQASCWNPTMVLHTNHSFKVNKTIYCPLFLHGKSLLQLLDVYCLPTIHSSANG